MKIALLAAAACALPCLAPLAQDPAAEEFPAVPFARSVEQPNHLTPLEARAGWRLLFDGESTEGWVARDGGSAPVGWVVDDGCLHRALRTQDLFSATHFGDFELTFEWKVADGVNSGLKYRLDGFGTGTLVLGPEYQVLDDTTAEANNAKHAASALYDIVAPRGSRPLPAGEFNRARIVARGNRIEHWLNGVRVVDVDLGSAEWKDAVEKSKFRGVEGFGTARKSPLMLQEHGGAVWYRSIKIREFDALPGEEVELFDGKDIAGWRALGDAIYEADEGSILGRIGGGSQSFLVTERTFGDFLLEVELKNELPGNSGIQVRSHQRENGRTYGYQIEIDASERAWSAGLYDEARRGWLQNLVGNEPGRRAFRNGDWNLYRIECVGPWIRVWLNGVPTVDYFDTADLEGVLGLQVHSGNNTRVRWRNFRMRDLGQARWKPLFDGKEEAELLTIPASAWEIADGALRTKAGEHVEGCAVAPWENIGDFAARIVYRAPEGHVELHYSAMPSSTSEAVRAGSAGVAASNAGEWDFATSDEGVAEHVRADEVNELTICSFGGRVVLHLNGTLVDEIRFVSPLSGGFLMILPPAGKSLAIERIEELVLD